MKFLQIVILSVAAAVAYGVVHDQVTARICIEYFTVGHPPLIDSDSPTLIALAWGVVATWWMGALLGVPLAAAARIGGWPKLTASDLVAPIVKIMLVMGAAAFVSGLIGRELASDGHVSQLGWAAEVLPPERHVDFLTAWWAHSAAYVAGAGGGIVLWLYAIRRRFLLHRAAASHPIAAPGP